MQTIEGLERYVGVQLGTGGRMVVYQTAPLC